MLFNMINVLSTLVSDTSFHGIIRIIAYNSSTFRTIESTGMNVCHYIDDNVSSQEYLKENENKKLIKVCVKKKKEKKKKGCSSEFLCVF